MTEIRRELDLKLGESNKAMQRQFGESAKIIRDVTERLIKLDETNKQVVNFADQLQNLQDILKNPKQRGVLGEYYLKTVLENVLPPGAYEMQYKFKDGTIVDAAIFIKDRIIPIDSKFSLENYNRLLQSQDGAERKKLEDAFRGDLKNRIDETSKYIKPGERTMDFAFMFIPAEAVYYDLLINKIGSVNARDLIEYAIVDRKVIIVSPTSFLAYLQTVLQGLKAMQIEESAKEIRKRVEELGRHLGSYETYMKKLGTHLGTSVNMYNSAYKELGKIDKDVLRISGEAVNIEPTVLEGPRQNE
jgi:DNA recombination protein RmuC